MILVETTSNEPSAIKMRTAYWVCSGVSSTKQMTRMIKARSLYRVSSTAPGALLSRNFVWHAGLIEESIADEIIDEIKFERIQIIKLIDEELPSSSSSWLITNNNNNNNNKSNNNQKKGKKKIDLTSSASAAPLTRSSTVQEVMNTILQREQNILQLRQRYKDLTGDDDDEEYDATNIRKIHNKNTFNDSAAVQTIIM